MLTFQFVSNDDGGALFSDDNPSSMLSSFPSLKILSSLCLVTFAMNMLVSYVCMHPCMFGSLLYDKIFVADHRHDG